MSTKPFSIRFNDETTDLIEMISKSGQVTPSDIIRAAVDKNIKDDKYFLFLKKVVELDERPYKALSKIYQSLATGGLKYEHVYWLANKWDVAYIQASGMVNNKYIDILIEILNELQIAFGEKDPSNVELLRQSAKENYEETNTAVEICGLIYGMIKNIYMLDIHAVREIFNATRVLTLRPLTVWGLRKSDPDDWGTGIVYSDDREESVDDVELNTEKFSFVLYESLQAQLILKDAAILQMKAEEVVGLFKVLTAFEEDDYRSEEILFNLDRMNVDFCYDPYEIKNKIQLRLLDRDQIETFRVLIDTEDVIALIRFYKDLMKDPRWVEKFDRHMREYGDF